MIVGAAARDLLAVRRLAAAAEAADGHPALNEAVWRDLTRSDDDRVDVLATTSGHAGAVGYAHAGRGDNDSDQAWQAGFVVAPGARGAGVEDALLASTITGIAERGGGHVVLWRLGADAADDDVAARAGFAAARTLFEMRVRLPLTERPGFPPGVGVRAFEPGRDEPAWLAVNNRAFAGHPEQGGWSEATIRAREREPWFDPAGFLLAVRDDRILGFCWTKVHGHAHRGEIYVIGVDPDHGGGGLGRALVLAGLDHLAHRGLEIGMLFVDADNAAALQLYRSLGFEAVRADRAYERDVESART